MLAGEAYLTSIWIKRRIVILSVGNLDINTVNVWEKQDSIKERTEIFRYSKTYSTIAPQLEYGHTYSGPSCVSRVKIGSVGPFRVDKELFLLEGGSSGVFDNKKPSNHPHCCRQTREVTRNCDVMRFLCLKLPLA